jgi:hypothetical protein
MTEIRRPCLPSAALADQARQRSRDRSFFIREIRPVSIRPDGAAGEARGVDSLRHSLARAAGRFFCSEVIRWPFPR